MKKRILCQVPNNCHIVAITLFWYCHFVFCLETTWWQYFFILWKKKLHGCNGMFYILIHWNYLSLDKYFFLNMVSLINTANPERCAFYVLRFSCFDLIVNNQKYTKGQVSYYFIHSNINLWYKNTLNIILKWS